MVWIKHHKGNVIRLESDEVCMLNLIRENFSMPNPACRSNMPWMPKRLYAISPTFRCDASLAWEIVNFLSKYPHPYEIDPVVKQILTPIKLVIPKDTELLGISLTYRPYQDMAIREAILRARGIIKVSTSGGKSAIMAGLIRNQHPKKTLVIVPTIQLVEQTAKDFMEYGLKRVSKWSGSNSLQADSSVIVCNTQILLSKNTDLNFLSKFDLVLCDECHVFGKRACENNKIFKFLNTFNIFGFTGTLPPSKIDAWNIIGKIGPVIFEETTKNLLAKGYITNFSITVLELEHKTFPKFKVDIEQPTKAYLEEQEYLMKLERRNEIIAKLSIQLKSNTLIMVDRIFYGELLTDLLKSKTTQPVYFIKGEVEMEDRENLRILMNQQSDVIVVAVSKIFSTGINIPNLNNIIFSLGGKSFIRIIQSIGRSLRLHPTKTKANIFDISDNTRYSKRHAAERIEIYEKEEYPYQIKKIQI